MFSAIEKWVSLITGKKTARGAKVAGQMALSSHITTTRSERKLFGWIDFLFLFYKSPHRSALNWFMIRKWNSDNSIRLPKKFFLRSISFQMSLQMFPNHNFSYFTIKSIYFGGYQRNNCYTKVFFGEQHTITIWYVGNGETLPTLFFNFDWQPQGFSTKYITNGINRKLWQNKTRKKNFDFIVKLCFTTNALLCNRI